MKTDWSSLWKKEDWWAVWIGFFILLLGIARWLPSVPAISKWTSVAGSFPAGPGTFGPLVLLFVITLVPTLAAMALVGKNVRQYIYGFVVVFGLAFVIAQTFNVLWAPLIVWLLWSGVLFTSPIK